MEDVSVNTSHVDLEGEMEIPGGSVGGDKSADSATPDNMSTLDEPVSVTIVSTLTWCIYVSSQN